MKLRYLNGEKVYVKKECLRGPPDEFGMTFHDGLKIIRHRDVVRILNRVFQEAEAQSEDIDMALYCVIASIEDHTKGESWGLQSEVVEESKVVFDNLGSIRLAKAPRLRIGKPVNPKWTGKPYILGGGQHKPVPSRKKDDILTDEFRSFLARKQDGESAGNEVSK